MPKDKPKRPAPLQIPDVDDKTKRLFQGYAKLYYPSQAAFFTQMFQAFPGVAQFIAQYNLQKNAQDKPQKKSS